MSAKSPQEPKPYVSVEDAEVGMTNAALAEMPEIGDARYLGVVRGKQIKPQYTEEFKNYINKTILRDKPQDKVNENRGNTINPALANWVIAGWDEKLLNKYVEQYITDEVTSPYIDFEGDFEGDFEPGFKNYIISQLEDTPGVTDENYLEKVEKSHITGGTLLDKLYYLRGKYLATNVKQVLPQDPANPARAPQANPAQAQASARAQQAQATARAQANPGKKAASEHYDIPLDPIPYLNTDKTDTPVKTGTPVLFLSDKETQAIMTKLKQEVTEIYDKFDDLFIKFSLNKEEDADATQQVFADVIKKMKKLAQLPVDGDSPEVKAEKDIKYGNYLSIMRQVQSFYPDLYDKVKAAMEPGLSVTIPNYNNRNPNAMTPTTLSPPGSANSKWSLGSATPGTGRSLSQIRPGSALPSPYTPQKPQPTPPTSGGKGSKKISSRFKPQIV